MEVNINELENRCNGRQSELKTIRFVKKIFAGQGIIIDNRHMTNMSVTEFVYLINLISDDDIAELMFHRINNRQFNRIFKDKINEALLWDNDLVESAIIRICFWEDGFKDMIQGINQEKSSTYTTIKKTEPEDEQFFMQNMKNNHLSAYTAMKNGLLAGIVELKDSYFNFKCNKGCVGYVFNEAGYTEWKQIGQYILINDEKPGKYTLRNCTSNTPPDEWEKIKPIFFPIMSE